MKRQPQSLKHFSFPTTLVEPECPRGSSLCTSCAHFLAHPYCDDTDGDGYNTNFCLTSGSVGLARSLSIVRNCLRQQQHRSLKINGYRKQSKPQQCHHVFCLPRRHPPPTHPWRTVLRSVMLEADNGEQKVLDTN